MTQEEKQLLLKDLCAKLPYGIKFPYHMNGDSNHKECDCIATIDGISDDIVEFTYEENGVTRDWSCPISEVKPYLRPMSSMTKEEIEEYRNLSDEVIGSYGPYHHEYIAHCVRLGIKPDNPHECVDDFLNMGAIDWLLAHHFDYRGLIEKGLALEAPEDMYKKN